MEDPRQDLRTEDEKRSEDGGMRMEEGGRRRVWPDLALHQSVFLRFLGLGNLFTASSKSFSTCEV